GAEGPEHALLGTDRGACSVDDGNELVVLGLARGESSRDGGDSRESARCSNYVRVDGGDRRWAQRSSKVGRIAPPASTGASPRTTRPATRTGSHASRLVITITPNLESSTVLLGKPL